MILQNEYEESLPYLENSLEVLEEQGDEAYRTHLAENILASAQAYLELGKPELAKVFLDRELHTEKPELWIKKYRLLAALFQGHGGFCHRIPCLKNGYEAAGLHLCP